MNEDINIAVDEAFVINKIRGSVLHFLYNFENYKDREDILQQSLFEAFNYFNKRHSGTGCEWWDGEEITVYQAVAGKIAKCVIANFTKNKAKNSAEELPPEFKLNNKNTYNLTAVMDIVQLKAVIENELTGKEREFLQFYQESGFDLQKTAKILNISVENSYSIWRKIKKIIKENYEY